MKRFSTTWNASSQPRKQRAYLLRVPMHIKSALMKSHVDKKLQTKVKARSLRVRTGDTVKIMRGSFKNKIGKVERIDVKTSRVYIAGVEKIKKDGSKIFLGVKPHILLITEIDTTDKRRFA